MKNYLLILFISLALVSCEKQDDDLIEENNPSVTSATFYCVYAGSNSSQAVNVDVVIPDSGSISKLSLYSKTGTELYYVENPESGVHTLFNHVGDCEPSVAVGSYYFVFTRQDNTKVITGGYPE